MTDPTGLPDRLFDQAVKQIVNAAGPGGITEEHLLSALAELDDIRTSAAIWQAWRSGAITLAAREGTLILKSSRQRDD